MVQINLYNLDSNGIPTNRSGVGSGFFWDKEGNILTNYHVIQPAISSKNTSILVRTFNNDEYKAENYYRRGDPETPMSQGEIENKFRELTKGFLPKSDQEKYIKWVASIETTTGWPL